MKRTVLIGIILLLGIVAAGFYWQGRSTQGPVTQAKLISYPTNLTGFARADGPQKLSFPKDFGAHSDFQTEWWYYTGNLDSNDGRHFGYQLTFFRRSLIPLKQAQTRRSDWATTQVYMAHFALTDVTGKKFQSFERLERGAAGLAGASVDPNFKVWLQDWSIVQTGPTSYTMKAAQGGISLELSLEDQKGPILEGNQGYSQKGPEAGNASYYISQTRLITKGTVGVQGQTFSVKGTSWMDHEYSTSALSSGQTGWDWFALQLSDQTEVMVYQIRREDGSKDPYSSGTFVEKDSKTNPLKSGDFSIQATGSWKSPATQAVYPSGWKIEIPSEKLSLIVQPYLQDQENRLTFTYWEGAVKLSGTRDGKSVSGVGYVELTGYSGSLAGQF